MPWLQEGGQVRLAGSASIGNKEYKKRHLVGFSYPHHEDVSPHSHMEAASSLICSLLSGIPERVVYFLAPPITITHSVDIFVQGLWTIGYGFYRCLSLWKTCRLEYEQCLQNRTEQISRYFGTKCFIVFDHEDKKKMDHTLNFHVIGKNQTEFHFCASLTVLPIDFKRSHLF